MNFEFLESPFENGTAWIIDISWETSKRGITKSDGSKVEIARNNKHENIDLIVRVFHEGTEALYEVSYEKVNASAS
ncbi:hypothetical protein [Shewanella xiamenensis]|uniref:hypothetical protein n=1 Tax=Shewanella xiamenensis TaxID=332186 RepID=UPI00313B9C31